MAYKKLVMRRDRLRINRLMLDLARCFYDIGYGENNFGGIIDNMFVGACVAIGHAEGRPMNATKVAHYLDMPRTTVLRKLEELVELGLLERTGTYYYISEQRMNAGADRLLRANQLIIAAYKDLQRQLEEESRPSPALPTGHFGQPD
jgi:hypothetical protein